MSLEIIEFHPVKKSGSLIGFCSFKWNNEFQFTEIAVHKLLKSKGALKVRLNYHLSSRPKGNAYSEILKDINAYIVSNYPEVLQ